MDIQKFIKDDLEIRVRINEDDTIDLNLKDIADKIGTKQSTYNKVDYYNFVKKLNTYEDKLYGNPSLLKKVVENNTDYSTFCENTYISESLFYFTCIRANTEKAIEFQLWICEEVLPSLRKNNYYIDKENITSEQFEDLQKEIIDLIQQRDNFKNILVNNKRKKQRLKTFLEDMFPECEDVYEQFLWNMYDKGTLDGNFMPTEKFIKQNELKNMFIHITKTNKEVTHDLILTNVGMAELSQRLYLENNALKIKVDKKKE